MIAASQLTNARFVKLKSNKNAILKRTKALFSNSEFDSSVRTSTNTPSKVKLRVESVISLLREI